MTSIDVKNKNNLSNANVITTQGATNEVSNYQKYIKNVKFLLTLLDKIFQRESCN